MDLGAWIVGMQVSTQADAKVRCNDDRRIKEEDEIAGEE